MNTKKENQNQDANRDPITGEPGAHPVGTGTGAVAGGAVAGAITGTLAGPIGTGIGAAAGAVVGGLAGKAVGEQFNPTEAGELERFMDYTVVDQNDDKIGTIDAVWEDHAGQPAYLAVRTGWLGFGKAHVVPAQNAEMNQERKRIRLPYTAEQVKKAPSFDSQCDITEESEFTIASHFGTQRHWENDVGSRPIADEKTGLSDADGNILPQEESTHASKREVEYGGMRRRNAIRTETANQPVELFHDEIAIERAPLTGSEQTSELTGNDDRDIYIPLRREEAALEKKTPARDEILTGKRRETDK